METTPGQKSCPFCAELILAAARKCKHCGEFLTEERAQKAQVIEATGKLYKGIELFGVLLIPLSLVIWAQVDGNTGVPVFAVGCLLYFGGRIGGWWNHG